MKSYLFFTFLNKLLCMHLTRFSKSWLLILIWATFKALGQMWTKSTLTSGFNKAKIIVGYHGAGLANLVFSSSPAKVIELYPSTKQKIRINIKVISKIKNLEHIFFFIKYRSNQDKLKNLTYYDGIVDIVEFKKLIKEIL